MFTFKTTRPTGRFLWVSDPYHEIKLQKKVVGSIDNKVTHRIRLKVTKVDINEDGNPNCPWKWIILKKESLTLDEAKKWLNENFEAITNKYNIWKAE